MIPRALILLLLAVLAVSAQAQQIVAFANGTAEVQLPDTFVATPRSDGSLLAVFGEAKDHRLELTLNEAPGSSTGSSLGEAFVRSQAEKKGRRISSVPGKVVFMDPAGDTQQDGRTFRTVHWQIGFGNSVVVMTLTAPAEGSPALNQFLGKPLNDAVSSLRRRAA